MNNLFQYIHKNVGIQERNIHILQYIQSLVSIIYFFRSFNNFTHYYHLLKKEHYKEQLYSYITS